MATDSLQTSARAPAKRKRPVGRPRRDGRPHLRREEALWASARLIAQHGFAGTSIRMIAGELHISPASLFNLFSSKDALLNELIIYASAPSLAFYEQIRERELSPPLALYKSLHAEVTAVASAERAFPALFYLPELQKSGFEPAQQTRAAMVSHYRSLLEEGKKALLFDCDHPELVAEQFFQLTETTIVAGDKLGGLSIDVQAASTARLCLRSVLRDVNGIDLIAQQAETIDLTIKLPTMPS